MPRFGGWRLGTAAGVYKMAKTLKIVWLLIVAAAHFLLTGGKFKRFSIGGMHIYAPSTPSPWESTVSIMHTYLLE